MSRTSDRVARSAAAGGTTPTSGRRPRSRRPSERAQRRRRTDRRSPARWSARHRERPRLREEPPGRGRRSSRFRQRRGRDTSDARWGTCGTPRGRRGRRLERQEARRSPARAASPPRAPAGQRCSLVRSASVLHPRIAACPAPSRSSPACCCSPSGSHSSRAAAYRALAPSPRSLSQAPPPAHPRRPRRLGRRPSHRPRLRPWAPSRTATAWWCRAWGSISRSPRVTSSATSSCKRPRRTSHSISPGRRSPGPWATATSTRTLARECSFRSGTRASVMRSRSRRPLALQSNL